MIINQNTEKWKASITVDLTPINKYGDEIGGSEISYTVHLNGSLLEIITKLESLNNG